MGNSTQTSIQMELDTRAVSGYSIRGLAVQMDSEVQCNLSGNYFVKLSKFKNAAKTDYNIG